MSWWGIREVVFHGGGLVLFLSVRLLRKSVDLGWR